MKRRQQALDDVDSGKTIPSNWNFYTSALK